MYIICAWNCTSLCEFFMTSASCVNITQLYSHVVRAYITLWQNVRVYIQIITTEGHIMTIFVSAFQIHFYDIYLLFVPYCTRWSEQRMEKSRSPSLRIITDPGTILVTLYLSLWTVSIKTHTCSNVASGNWWLFLTTKKTHFKDSERHLQLSNPCGITMVSL